MDTIGWAGKTDSKAEKTRKRTQLVKCPKPAEESN